VFHVHLELVVLLVHKPIIMIQQLQLQIHFVNHVEFHNVHHVQEVLVHSVHHHTLYQEIVVFKHYVIHHVLHAVLMQILVLLVNHIILLQVQLVQPALVIVIHVISYLELMILLHVHNVKMDIIWFNKQIIK
jgi:hypothetical protein